ncbi:hypothetical protein [Acinetobacter baumannii]|uniref:hypothetical protein n=1 Tax=Acinetobacter baumannii TaxID=470 RepID=UPI001FFE9BD9|nr:hypothetical protein [Acinetobacter baumannii]
MQITNFDLVHLIDKAIEEGQIKVKILADSINEYGDRLVTFELMYWLPIHAEMMTHRVFSRNAASNRAIPISKIIQQVWNNPAYPIFWGKNKAGMQANEQFSKRKIRLCRFAWKWSGRLMCGVVWSLMKLGLHKQTANRLLMPWQFMHVVLSSTEMDNFFDLRIHEDAQFEIFAVAYLMDKAMRTSTPKKLKFGEWHLPYITDEERKQHKIDVLKKVSGARCCRVSFLNHYGNKSNVGEDLKLCERLVGAEPLHASPFEHQATPDSFDHRTEKYANPTMHGNLKGWLQHRKFIEVEIFLSKNKE